MTIQEAAHEDSLISNLEQKTAEKKIKIVSDSVREFVVTTPDLSQNQLKLDRQLTFSKGPFVLEREVSQLKVSEEILTENSNNVCIRLEDEIKELKRASLMVYNRSGVIDTCCLKEVVFEEEASAGQKDNTKTEGLQESSEFKSAYTSFPSKAEVSQSDNLKCSPFDPSLVENSDKKEDSEDLELEDIRRSLKQQQRKSRKNTKRGKSKSRSKSRKVKRF